ncbi:SpoIIE family protein phosphatase [Bernardetia sp.]|uniref:SpoIIE family protein phosphatase n=1 Tax=Bernardetia sp. TaxID=1937974 RepID=UPI0025C06264|nr:SpoIIE family protein phosphatase [Bernardetia sp.]
MGSPLVRNFGQEEHGGASQNWAITQTPNNIIYVGNNGGVLEFDGVSWNRYRTANQSTVKSLATDSYGRVFVGAKGELGVLKPDSTNTLHYVSLMDKIPKEVQNFTDVWQTFVVKDKIYFRTKEHIFIFTNKETKLEFFKFVSSEKNFHTAFLTNNTFYVRDMATGLCTFNQNYELEPVAENTDNTNVYGVLSDTPSSILVLSRPEGIYKIQNKTTIPISFSSSETLNKYKGYCSVMLPNKNIAIGTLRNGIYITDFNGNVKLHLSKENILESNTIYDIFLDNKNNLWAATDNGIACVYLSIPYSTIGEKQGVFGRGLNTAYSSAFNRIYIGTTFGVYHNDFPVKIDPVTGKQKSFSILAGTEGYALDVLNQNKALYYGHNLGIFKVVDTSAYNLLVLDKRSQATWAVRSTTSEIENIDSLQLLAVYSKQIALLTKSEHKSEFEDALVWNEKIYSNFEEPIRHIVENKGYWWARNSRKGVFRLKFSENYDSLLEVKIYGVEEGVPSLEETSIYKIQDKIVLTFEDKVYSYDASQDKFVIDKKLNSLLEGQNITDLYQDREGNIWYRKKGEKEVLWNESGKYRKQSDFMAGLKTYNELNGMAVLPKHKIAIGIDEGVVFIDTKQKFLTKQKPNVFVRRIDFLGETDSLLFGGVFFDSDSIAIGKQPKSQILQLSADINALRFSFASPSMPFSKMTQYRYKLEGLDEKWSAWTDKTQKEYTNLSDKKYIFKVQAKNLWGAESEEVTYQFEIFSPWYKTWWAYAAYTILAILIIWAIVKLNTKRLEREKRKLEEIVEVRTAEVVQQKEELQMQADNLAQANVAINNQKEELEQQAENLFLANTAINQQKEEIEKSYQNVRTLSQIGQKITNILDVKTLIQTVYENINTLMPADGFGIGVLNKEAGRIDFEGFIENNETLPAHADSLKDDTKLSVRSLKNNQRLIINDLQSQYKEYFDNALEEVEVGNLPYSLVYLPLHLEGETVGVLTVQSMETHTYSSLELDMLDTLGAYTAIALNNIKAYQIIENKNTNITDSIRYAQTIQQAVLPIKTELQDYFEDHFVIFRPKDIVSGDFYWATQTKDKTFIAVVDCTGHGVPGAFMSMLGHAFLNEAVSQQHLTDPASILEWLHKEIRTSLRQDQKVNADGMDISLCVIDRNISASGDIKVMYCGAKRPLFYVLPTNDLQVVKGNRRSIGGYSRKKRYQNFSSQELILPKETMLYLYSDGYPDQSDENGVKLGTNKILEYLPTLAALETELQKQALTKLLDNHQKTISQRDDITFLGIRL